MSSLNSSGESLNLLAIIVLILLYSLMSFKLTIDFSTHWYVANNFSPSFLCNFEALTGFSKEGLVSAMSDVSALGALLVDASLPELPSILFYSISFFYYWFFFDFFLI